MLPDASADRQYLLERQTDSLPVKSAHLFDLIGKDTDVDELFYEFHVSISHKTDYLIASAVLNLQEDCCIADNINYS
jgi:phosphopantetheinyl transferase (holo-ACP synthase)